MKLKTQYDIHDRIYCRSGDKEHVIYSSKYNDDGIIELYEIGRQDIPAYINSHAESVDINVLMERYAEGDTEVLNRRQTLFGDFTQLPKTLADSLNLAIEGQKFFDSLPVETKKKFDNSFAVWLATVDKVKAAEAAAQPEEVPSSGEEAEKQA